ncbi:hypothetical protein NHG22_34420 [Streptomyces sp. ATE26]|uniref:hypothetical protein n=1 Tax=Streptomyces sp. ATE26 TaxID=2954237 RepID=UPI002482E7BC|nr:hypothetical protein [Streptomyces sp. ATE26]MDI1458874.1 hypothetical protein [Streptomyces sp. ATE26]
MARSACRTGACTVQQSQQQEYEQEDASTAGADPATLTRDTLLAGVKIGSWLARQLTAWQALAEGQQQLMTALGLTPRGESACPRAPYPPHL